MPRAQTKQNNKRYSPQFIAEAKRRIAAGESIMGLSKKLKVSNPTLYKWAGRTGKARAGKTHSNGKANGVHVLDDFVQQGMAAQSAADELIPRVIPRDLLARVRSATELLREAQRSIGEKPIKDLTSFELKVIHALRELEGQ